MAKEHFAPPDVERFKQVQRLAYEAVLHVEKELHEGMTEKIAASLIEGWLRDHGIKRFFHHGFAWFADRSAFRGFVKPRSGALSSLMHPYLLDIGRQFQPTERRLHRGDAVILDVAPVVDEIPADIGYAFAFGENQEVHAARMALEPYRKLILDMVKQQRSQRDIYAAVDALVAEQGYEQLHSYYPGRVLAHKVGKLPLIGMKLPRIGGFDLQGLIYLSRHVLGTVGGGLRGEHPLWNDLSVGACEPGLWAVEPHIGRGAVGAKWEELLVVTEQDAYWLDDDLPHVRYWTQHARSAA
jgi:Xaa-Pro aminopeptidase